MVTITSPPKDNRSSLWEGEDEGFSPGRDGRYTWVGARLSLEVEDSSSSGPKRQEPDSWTVKVKRVVDGKRVGARTTLLDGPRIYPDDDGSCVLQPSRTSPHPHRVDSMKEEPRGRNTVTGVEVEERQIYSDLGT